MKKIVMLMMIIISFSFAKGSDVATKDDLKEMKNEIIGYIDKRFEQIDKRFDMMQHNMDKRFEQIDKRFDMMQKEIDNNARIANYMMIAFFVLIMGYLLKERSIWKRDLKEELKDELSKKADNRRVDEIVSVIEDFAKKDDKFREVLERHHLKYVA